MGTPNTIAAYVVRGENGVAMIETGPTSCIPAAKAGLAEIGLSPTDVKHVLLTHIHFDHAGAAGWWAQQGAHIYVHHVGAKHMIDPSKLVASATRIYGDLMETMWGELIPIDPNNLTALSDGDQIVAGDLTFEALDTPGHASHHMTYRIGDIAFTGDSAGTRLGGRELIDIPASPPEYNVELWLDTVERLKSYNFREIYPTHFGKIEAVEAHLSELLAFIPAISNFIKGLMEAEKSKEEILSAFEDWQRERAVAAHFTPEDIHKYFTANPLDISVAGITRYWRKRWEKEAENRSE